MLLMYRRQPTRKDKTTNGMFHWLTMLTQNGGGRGIGMAQADMTPTGEALIACNAWAPGG
jgi:hypothetical protein